MVWHFLVCLTAGGIFTPVGGRAWRTRGKWESPSCRARVRCASPSTGRSFLIGGDGTFVRHSKGRYTGERPFVRCLEESWALKTEREGNEMGSLAVTGTGYCLVWSIV